MTNGRKFKSIVLLVLIWTLKTFLFGCFEEATTTKREKKDVIMNHFLSPFMKSVMVFCVLFQRGFLTTSLRIWFISPDHDQCIFLLFKGTLFNSKIFGWSMNHCCGQMAWIKRYDYVQSSTTLLCLDCGSRIIDFRSSLPEVP